MTPSIRYAVAAALVAAAAGTTLVLLGGSGDRDPVPGGAASSPASASATPSDDGFPRPEPSEIAVVIANASGLAELDGTPVAGTGVRVQQRVDANAIWVGEAPGRRVLLLLVGGDLPPFTVRAGDTVSFTGQVRRAAAGFAAGIGLTGEDRAELERQGAYVEVSEPYRTGN